MKFNWGTGITLVIIAFMGFILFMVFKATQTNPDLYAEDYYAQEISYQQRINALSNGRTVGDDVQISDSDQRILLEYPEGLLATSSKAQIEFFRPDNAALDRSFAINLQGSSAQLSKTELLPGRYNVRLRWNMNGQPYALERSIEIQK